MAQIIHFLLIICASLLPQVFTDISMTNNELGLDLVRLFSDENQNTFFSPLSISTTFKMLLAGARGKTQTELKDMLGYSDMSPQEIHQEMKDVMLQYMNRKLANKGDKDVTMTMANRILVKNQYPIKKQFMNVMANTYLSQVDAVDFSENAKNITMEVNNWVSNMTQGNIPKVFTDSLSPDTLLVLINAVYFKGSWSMAFNPNETTKENFHNLGSATTGQVDMMHNTDEYHYLDLKTQLDAQLIKLPYKDSFDAYILLPNQIDGLDKMVEKLSLDVLENAINSTKKISLDLSLPKFKLETEYQLKDALEDLEVRSLFNHEADLSGINGKKNLRVSQAVHKAYVDVNEEGTEASAVTGIQIVPSSYTPKPEFKVDRPFMFLIRDNSNGVFTFIGLVRNLINDELLSLGFI